MQSKRKNLLRLFLFFPILLLSQDVFTLPEEADHLIYTLTQELSQADKEVYIFSSKLNGYKLITTLKKLTKKNITIHIISADLSNSKNKASYLNLLEGVHLYTLVEHEDRVIKGSLLCIDDNKLYLSSASLDKVSIYNNYSFVLSKQTECNYLFKRVINRSTKIQ